MVLRVSLSLRIVSVIRSMRSSVRVRDQEGKGERAKVRSLVRTSRARNSNIAPFNSCGFSATCPTLPRRLSIPL